MEQTTLSAKDYTIKDYLKADNVFLIPRYQRNYAWEKKNVIQLLEDVVTENGYYIGNIIVNTSEDNIKEVIDGQQRLISVFLILIALKNQRSKLVTDYILKEGNLKLNIEKRIEGSGVNIMKAILDDSIPSNIEKYSEVKRYKNIKREMNKYTPEMIDTLMERLLAAKIVEIKFENREKQAHEMFVSLNTKGKPLEEIEIIKSHLFKYLAEGSNFDSYKEEWYNMLDCISDKYSGKYLQNVSLLKSATKEKKTAKEALNYLLKSVTSSEEAEELFGFMAGSDEKGLYKVYAAVKKHALKDIEESLNLKSEISFESLDEIWKMFGQIKFEQFDVVMVSILYCPTKDKRKEINKDFLNIVKFLKLLLLFQLYNTIKRVSPSTYTNRFEAAAIDIFNGKKITKVLADLVKELKINTITEDEVKAQIQNLRCTSDRKANNKNSRDLKFAKYIVQIMDENYIGDLKAEHIIPESSSTDEKIKLSIGNILPVIKDRYGDKTVEEKLKLYKEDVAVNKSIKALLDTGITEHNYEDVIEQRTEDIAQKFWDSIDGLKSGVDKW